jgi:hypothetical protein
MIAPLCATQVLGQAFLCIPSIPNEANARERVNTGVVTVLKGNVTAKQMEDEITRILPKSWRWTARKVADNMFTVRFPNANLIKKWNCFILISIRSIKVELQVDPWNGVVCAKAELQQAWFRVRRIPYDKRSKSTLAYVGSLAGATMEVDESTLNMTDYVRIKIVARDVSKIPDWAEGIILPLLYDFFYEREVQMGPSGDGHPVVVPTDKGGSELPSLKKKNLVVVLGIRLSYRLRCIWILRGKVLRMRFSTSLSL